MTDVDLFSTKFNDYIDVNFLLEAEIKHAPICMLDMIGFMAAEIYTFPLYAGALHVIVMQLICQAVLSATDPAVVVVLRNAAGLNGPGVVSEWQPAWMWIADFVFLSMNHSL